MSQQKEPEYLKSDITEAPLSLKKFSSRELASYLIYVSLEQKSNCLLELRSKDPPGGHSITIKIRGAGSIVLGLGFWLGKIFWGSSKILIWTIVRG